jgi:hypothetical protein
MNQNAKEAEMIRTSSTYGEMGNAYTTFTGIM